MNKKKEHINRFLKLFFGLFLSANFFHLLAQETNNSLMVNEIYHMSLEEMGKVVVRVALKSEISLEESPGIVTVITKEEIRQIGARDLTDILQFVPGFHVISDVQGIIGLGVRGINSIEGKVLLMVDGLELNEPLLGNIVFAGHYFVDQIERIEIIRGPGSALYGGYAELSVINIITKNSDDQGVSFSGFYGQMTESAGRKGLTGSFSKNIKDLNIDVSAGIGDGILSDKLFSEFDSVKYPMNEYYKRNAWNVNLGADYKGLKVKVIADNFSESSSYLRYDSVPRITDFITYLGEISYDIVPGEKLKVTPKFRYSYFESFRTNEQIDFDSLKYYNKPTSIYRGDVLATYKLNQSMNINAGVDYFYVKSIIPEDAPIDNPQSYFNDSSKSMTFYTLAAFGEVHHSNPLVNVTVGARFEQNGIYGNAFVPRIALTKKIKKINLKMILNKSFRAPTIENMNSNREIKPETTFSGELEVGYLFTPHILISANLFDMSIKDGIVYDVDPISFEYNFYNFEQTATQGIEATILYKKNSGSLNLLYAYHRIRSNTVPIYDAYDSDGNRKENVLLGFPTHKLNLIGNILIGKNLNLNISAIAMSKRFNTYWSEVENDFINQEVEPKFILNANLVYADFLIKNLDFSFGVFDILNQNLEYTPGYLNYDLPTPGPSREFVIKLRYNIGFQPTISD